MRVRLTRAPPLAVVRQVQPIEDQRVDGVAKQNLGEGILPIGGIAQRLDGFFGEIEKLVARERGFELLDLILDPGVIRLAGCDGGPHGDITLRTWGGVAQVGITAGAGTDGRDRWEYHRAMVS